MQTELTRLRLYDNGIDGKPGFFTHQGLIEAFGGYEWVDLSDEEMLKRLQAAKTPPVKSGHRLRYGVMFADGVLDVTLGIGYWEGMTDQMEKVRDDVSDALKSIGFTAQFDVAQRVLQKAMRPTAGGFDRPLPGEGGRVHLLAARGKVAGGRRPRPDRGQPRWGQGRRGARRVLGRDDAGRRRLLHGHGGYG